MAQPVIGLTLDHEPPGGYSNFPWYAIRENYCHAVRNAGGLPILLPHDPDDAPAYLDRIDGLIVTGGGFDVDQVTARPLLGWAHYATPIRNLFLCGAGTHPGAGLDGRAGMLAARHVIKSAFRNHG